MKDGAARATNVENARAHNFIGIGVFRCIQPHSARFHTIFKTVKIPGLILPQQRIGFLIFPVNKYHGDIII